MPRVELGFKLKRIVPNSKKNGKISPRRSLFKLKDLQKKKKNPPTDEKEQIINSNKKLQFNFHMMANRHKHTFRPMPVKQNSKITS